MKVKEFTSFGQMAAHLLTLEVAMALEMRKGLKKVASAIEQTARNELGQYQKETGPFAAWAQLADSTKEDRERKGFTPNDPGVRTGEMRDSIRSEVSGMEAVVGSDDEHLLYFELGTDKQPPRSVLGMAVIRNRELIEKELGRAVVRGMTGADPIGGDYDF